MNLRLHFNENTGGCSPAVLAALRSIEPLETSTYPDYADVTAAVERWFNVAAGWVQLTNGLDEGLHVVAQLAGSERGQSRVGAGSEPGQSGVRAGSELTPQAVIVEPAFEMYKICADAAGLETVHVAPGRNFDFPLDALLGAMTPATRLVNLTDPNNPTGLAIPAGTAERLAQATPHAWVLVDEAYGEFSGHTLIGAPLDRHRNLVVGRTFAKAHGLAGLRLGALVAHPDTLARIRRLLPPFSINICGVKALGAALDDRPFLDAYVAAAAQSRELIYTWCRRRGVTYWPSEANFVLIQVGDRASDLVNAVAARGILLRDKTGAPGCAGCIRITAGLIEHTELALAALESALAARAR